MGGNSDANRHSSTDANRDWEGDTDPDIVPYGNRHWTKNPDTNRDAGCGTNSDFIPNAHRDGSDHSDANEDADSVAYRYACANDDSC